MPQSKINRIGVFLPNWIGDVVMATPALHAIRKGLEGHIHVTGIARPYVQEVLEGDPCLDQLIVYDRKSPHRHQRGWHLAKRLRQCRFDAVLNFTNSPRTAMLAWASAAPIRIGHSRYGSGIFLTHVAHSPQMGRRRLPHSAVEAYGRVTQLLGCPLRNRAVSLQTSPAQRESAERAWRQLGLTASRPVFGLNTGGAYGAAKRWPDRHFATLAERIVLEMGGQVLVVCGPAERESAANIVALADQRHVVSMANQELSVGLTKAALGRCQIVITTDSGPRHLAAAQGVPTVTLFGPTDPRWSHNYAANAIELQHHVPCGPCGKRACPLHHHECMEELTPDFVFHRVRQVWEKINREAA